MGEIQLVLGPMFSGKCLAAGTPVLRASGQVAKVEEIKVGDELLGDDLTARRVLQTASGMGRLLHVQQDNGAAYTVNDCHILSLKRKGAGLFADVPILNYLHSAELRRYWAGYTVVPHIFEGMSVEERLRASGKAPQGGAGVHHAALSWSVGRNALGEPHGTRFISDAGVAGGEQCLAIQEAGIGTFHGFVLDGNGRFVLGCCAVTHNTTELVRRGRRHEVAGRSCAFVKHARDRRLTEEAKVITHDRLAIASLEMAELLPHYTQLAAYDVILIDEGQFFDDIDAFAERAANDGKIVVISALDGDFNRRPFGRIPWLVPLAESVQKLNAVCLFCKKDAAFSLRTASSQDLVLIGGAESYVAACRKCFLAHTKQSPPT